MKLSLLILPLIAFSAIIGNNHLREIDKKNCKQEKPIFCVLKHTPGVNWKEGIPFQEQPGVEEHIKYMSQQLANGFLLMGGPFLDNSGGMMVCRTSDIEKAKEVGEADPSVISGLLKVEVKQWMIPMTSVELFPEK